jgi:hypothetical protein
MGNEKFSIMEADSRKPRASRSRFPSTGFKILRKGKHQSDECYTQNLVWCRLAIHRVVAAEEAKLIHRQI